MSGKIRVTVDKLGRPTIVGEGFIGQTCDEKMKPIEDAFKGGKSLRINSPEYMMVETEGAQEETITQ